MRSSQDSDSMMIQIDIILENAIFILNSGLEELEKVKYLNNRSSDFCLFKNKFAFVRNTRKLGWFVND